MKNDRKFFENGCKLRKNMTKIVKNDRTLGTKCDENGFKNADNRPKIWRKKLLKDPENWLKTAKNFENWVKIDLKYEKIFGNHWKSFHFQPIVVKYLPYFQ